MNGSQPGTSWFHDRSTPCCLWRELPCGQTRSTTTRAARTGHGRHDSAEAETSTAALILGVVSTVTAAAALGWSIAQGISSRHAAEREDARRVVEVGSPQEQVAVLRQLL
jgi:hypothetical protein